MKAVGITSLFRLLAERSASRGGPISAPWRQNGAVFCRVGIALRPYTLRPSLSPRSKKLRGGEVATLIWRPAAVAHPVSARAQAQVVGAAWPRSRPLFAHMKSLHGYGFGTEHSPLPEAGLAGASQPSGTQLSQALDTVGGQPRRGRGRDRVSGAVAATYWNRFPTTTEE